MEPLGISRNQLARDLDVPVGRISDITNGKRGITADTALRFGRYFGTGPELWMRLQAEYDLDVARAVNWRDIEQRVRILDADEVVDAGEMALPVPDASRRSEKRDEDEDRPSASRPDEEGREPPDVPDPVGEEDIEIPPAPLSTKPEISG